MPMEIQIHTPVYVVLMTKFLTNVINPGTSNSNLSSSIFKKIKSGAAEWHSLTIVKDTNSGTQDSHLLCYFNAHFSVG